MSVPDVVFVVREGERNEELRYSLRSLVNVPHGTVWLAGFTPSWVAGVESIPVEQTARKWANSTGNLRAACAHPEVSERFLYWNDDMFACRPMDRVTIWHRGPMRDVIRRSGMAGPYKAGAGATLRLLADLGHRDPLSFELHVPLPVDKDIMAEVLDMGAHIPVLHKRSAYGNIAGLTGEFHADVKIHDTRTTPPDDALFVSTNDRTFRDGAVGEWVRSRFPTPGPYERT